jgi:tetratricopeptide (TPR) repeat protein
MYRLQGQYEKATVAVQECLRLSKELGDKYEEVWFYWALSNIENQKGDLTTGRQYAEEGVQLARDLSDPLYTSYTLLGLGWNAYLRKCLKSHERANLRIINRTIAT